MIRQAKILSVFLTMLFYSTSVNAGFFLSAETSSQENLRWKKKIIPVAFSNSLLKQNPAVRPDSEIQEAVSRSLETWESAANIEFQVTWTDKLSVSPTGISGDGISLVTIAQTPENLLVFGGDSSDIAARTRVFFNRRGEISEADIVFNPYQQFSTDGAIGTFDFESTLTHELGHLLGLEHSTIAGATMNELQGKNGTFNLSSFSQRSLSIEDITRIRAIYGSKDDETCCGSIEGKILITNPKTPKNINLWLEDTDTGRVAVGGNINADGSFSLKGLSAGNYRIYVQDKNGNYAGQFLSEIEILRGKTTSFTKKIALTVKDFDVQFIGFQGQLSKLAIPINSGKVYQIYVGGKNLNAEDFKIGITSPYFKVSSGSMTNLDYGKDISVFSFEIKSVSETPIGDYTIFLQKSDGKTEFLSGSLSIEKFLNQWNTLTLD